MSAPLRRSIQDSPPETLVVFDLRTRGSHARLNDQRRSWGHHASIERLDRDHSALIIRAGGAQSIS